MKPKQRRHRSGLQELHSRLLTLQRRPGGGRPPCKTDKDEMPAPEPKS